MGEDKIYLKRVWPVWLVRNVLTWKDEVIMDRCAWFWRKSKAVSFAQKLKEST